MRILRCPQDQKITRFVQQVNKARISVCHVHDEVDDLPQNLIQIQRTTDRLADLMQDPELLPCLVERFLNGFDGVRAGHGQGTSLSD